MEDYVLSSGVSTGMALYPTDGHDVQTFIHNTDAAVYEAKRVGGNGLGFHASLNYERLMGMQSRDRSLDGEADVHQSIIAR